MDRALQLAAIDLGSNSFRLEICRVEHGHLVRTEYLKDTVRLGAGLDESARLDDASMQRGWASLARCAERNRGSDVQAVRAVATATLREAANREVFVAKAQSLLGLPIDVISGHEEARLIYGGVSHFLPPTREARLVFDIGGRSTELIEEPPQHAFTPPAHDAGRRPPLAKVETAPQNLSLEGEHCEAI